MEYKDKWKFIAKDQGEGSADRKLVRDNPLLNKPSSIFWLKEGHSDKILWARNKEFGQISRVGNFC